jgi:endonuclease YncB( thermonuclease family)
MKEQDPAPAPHAFSRRRFGRRAALTAVAGTLSSPLLDSQVGTHALLADDRAEVDAKYANVIRKYGARLSPAERVRARDTLLEHQRMLKRIRDFALENGDAPATGLRLYPSDTPERCD